MEFLLLPIIVSYLFEEDLDGNTLRLITEDSIEGIMDYASGQGVLPIAVASLNRYVESVPVLSTRKYLEYYGMAQISECKHARRLHVMQNLSKMMMDSGLDVMYLKGETLASLYPEPSLRECSDIDFYLYGHYDDGEDVLRRSGIFSRDYIHHHSQSVMGGILIENHYDFVDRKSHKCNIIIDDALKSLARSEGHVCPFLTDGTFSMTPTMNAIFLMRHMSAHFASETVILRQLLDWALFLRKHSDEVDWDMVLGVYEQSGMLTFANAIHYLIKEKMHIDAGSILPGDNVVNEAIVKKVWDSIIYPAAPNLKRKYSPGYWWRETIVFFNNRWKHQLVYPGESYARLFFVYLSSVVKRCMSTR